MSFLHGGSLEFTLLVLFSQKVLNRYSHCIKSVTILYNLLCTAHCNVLKEMIHLVYIPVLRSLVCNLYAMYTVKHCTSWSIAAYQFVQHSNVSIMRNSYFG